MLLQNEGSSFRRISSEVKSIIAICDALAKVEFSGPGSEIQRPLAIIVIDGLVTSTALTLLLVAAVYAFFEGNSTEAADKRISRKQPLHTEETYA
jgi:cobalt-zinc-cadmium resistance protein CzcA